MDSKLKKLKSNHENEDWWAETLSTKNLQLSILYSLVRDCCMDEIRNNFNPKTQTFLNVLFV